MKGNLALMASYLETGRFNAEKAGDYELATAYMKAGAAVTAAALLELERAGEAKEAAKQADREQRDLVRAEAEALLREVEQAKTPKERMEAWKEAQKKGGWE